MEQLTENTDKLTALLRSLQKTNNVTFRRMSSGNSNTIHGGKADDSQPD